jgi:Ala-tRNA(Pro) deacylase
MINIRFCYHCIHVILISDKKASGKKIPYQRVETRNVMTMEECAAVDRILGAEIVKTLFLCNRQQTVFYLFVTPGDKPFRSKDFSAALGISRVSFAPPERLEEMLGVSVGATTVFSLLLDSAEAVRIVFDSEVLRKEWFGCTDGTHDEYLKLRTQDLLQWFIPATGHVMRTVEV